MKSLICHRQVPSVKISSQDPEPSQPGGESNRYLVLVRSNGVEVHQFSYHLKRQTPARISSVFNYLPTYFQSHAEGGRACRNAVHSRGA